MLLLLFCFVGFLLRHFFAYLFLRFSALAFLLLCLFCFSRSFCFSSFFVCFRRSLCYLCFVEICVVFLCGRLVINPFVGMYIPMIMVLITRLMTKTMYHVYPCFDPFGTYLLPSSSKQCSEQEHHKEKNISNLNAKGAGDAPFPLTPHSPITKVQFQHYQQAPTASNNLQQHHTMKRAK